MDTDTYKTIETSSNGIYKEKGSKFISCAYPITNEDNIKEHIQNIKQKYFDANHRCFAWKLGINNNNWRTNDDGEPSGTAGKPILGQIKSHELTNIIIFVIRYFGGTKLGTSGLINAYKSAAANAIDNAIIVEKTVNILYEIFFSYDVLNDVMRTIKEEGILIISQKFDLNCSITFSVRVAKSENIITKLEKIKSVISIIKS